MEILNTCTKDYRLDPCGQEAEQGIISYYARALRELEWGTPLYVKVYTQIRYYEDCGKLKAGYSLASKATLAKQFGVTVRQIERAFDNLTNTLHKGSWVACDPRFFNGMKRIWVSNARAERGSMEELVEDILSRAGNNCPPEITTTPPVGETPQVGELPSQNSQSLGAKLPKFGSCPLCWNRGGK